MKVLYGITGKQLQQAQTRHYDDVHPVPELYADLVRLRKACRACAGGRRDSAEIGPWTLWQGNAKADLVVIGQDRGDTTYFEVNKGHDTPGNPTNRTLRHLLTVAGVGIELPSRSDCGGGTAFFTNSILCLKQGGMQVKVDPAWSANFGRLFLKPTIQLVAQRVVLTLGEQA